MSNSCLSPAAPIGGSPTGKIPVVSSCRRVPTNWGSIRTLQPSNEPVMANYSVPADFLVEGQVSGLGTVHPLLTISFLSTWFLPLEMRNTMSSVMNGLQTKRQVLKSILPHNTTYKLCALLTPNMDEVYLRQSAVSDACADVHRLCRFLRILKGIKTPVKTPVIAHPVKHLT